LLRPRQARGLADHRMERRVNEDERSPEGRGGQWGLVVFAWILVGVPLLWGVWNTLLKAAALFR
jgi:hypothetical protein